MRRKMITLLLLIAVITAGIYTGFCVVQDAFGYSAYAEDVGTLAVDILKVGKADAILVQCGGQTLVIDAGEEDDGAEVVTALQKKNCSRVDHLIITHFDKDHVGGADTLAEALELGTVYIPAYQGTSQEYFDFMDALARRGITPTALTEAEIFSLGTAQVLVEPPAEYVYNGSEEMDNNFSLITSVSHGNTRYLFAADAMKKRIREWLSAHDGETYDFLKVPHHGIYSTAQEELAMSAAPRYAVICDSKKHPADAGTITALRKAGATVLETKDGDIHVSGNGEKIVVRQDRR